MRIVFKVIAIIGVLSFLGGLKNGVFFIFGLILAGIFGYFGWRPEKKMDKKHFSAPIDPYKKITKTSVANNVKSSNKYSEIKHEIISNKELSETELLNQIESFKQKEVLLMRSYNDGLFNSQEYHHKKSELEAEVLKLSQLLTLKQLTKKILIENKDLFDRLLELKAKDLITNDEYKFKYNELMSSLLQKGELEKKEVEKVEHREINNSDKLIHEETTNSRKRYYLIGFTLILFLCVAILVFQYSSNKSNSHSSFDMKSNTVKNLSSEDKINNNKLITKDTINTTEIDKSNINVEPESKNSLDRIYLGTNLFHEGSGGTWGRATISKQGDHYWIKGEHKMSDGDWIKIEGEILNPTVEGFTFNGKITAYSPSEAKDVYEYEFYRDTWDNVFGDTCVWIGETSAYKLFEDRKYWRIKKHDCYPFTTDIDIFHN